MLVLNQRCVLYLFNACQNLKTITDYVFACYGSFFSSMRKEEKKERKSKKMRNFLKDYISGMAAVIYFRSSMCSLSICRHLHRKFGLETMELRTSVKSYFVLHVNILTLCAHAPFLGLHNTLPCVLI